jgi:2,4-dienoyl-CoA reductase-like NADH-dependent reductase (Old Yellow Enzyme family)
MSILFESTEINGMAVANRFVRSATWEGMAADDGACTPQLAELMGTLAAGGVGLIISGHCYVREDGKAAPRQLGVYDDRLVEGLKGMAETVHGRGGRIVLQLAHAGFYTSEKLTGRMPIAPTGWVEGLSKAPRREMTADDIRELVEDFGQAARRAKRAGFDGVQIHAAHGYLLSQFLSPVFNRRQDEFGGSLENRLSVILSVVERVRGAVGRDYPVLIKINSEDGLEGGLTQEDFLEAAMLIRNAGVDAIEVSGGTIASGRLSPSRTGIDRVEQEAYFRKAARAAREMTHLPVLLVGGIRSFEVAERIVEEGSADYISMSRPFIREPALINRWKAGDLRRAACISVNKCFGPAMKGEGLYCPVNRVAGDAKAPGT